ncbi:hypothetical protein PPACK8108_LOCUS15175 [Phakopsora pachyrhizi]|uniref:Ribosome biogenesis protein SLX9 n=1 Tax=Phakopsora pachyrhizi TaxID=170000 RepID=A0AAV0B9D8_PHAPC|nr:hypothetical protein PPACK8108_LOCUS15175 [Phakopsora pachyrhizi]
MPKASRLRFNQRHEPTINSLSKRRFSLPENHSQTLDCDEKLSANEILKDLNNPKAFITSKLSLMGKGKLDPIRQATSTGLSLKRRLKKKSRDQAVVGDLNPVKEALAEMDDDLQEAERGSMIIKPSTTSSTLTSSLKKSTQVLKSKKSISQNQKARVLKEESNRFPSIMIHPEFQKDPFGTIKTHVKNSLELTFSKR